MNTKAPYKTSDTTAANTSCDGLKVGPTELVVTLGNTMVSVVSAISTESAAFAPCKLEPLLPVTHPAREQAHPHDAVTHDHHRGEDRVAGQSCRLRRHP